VAHRDLSGAANEDLRVEYEPRLDDSWRAMLTPGSSLTEIERLLVAALAAGRRKDVAARVTLTGPHRDDLSISLNGASASSFGSRAQIRTATLSLRLAEARLLGEGIEDSPVIMLDDIVSELDARRRESVLAGLAGFEQVWLTTTDALSLPSEFVAGAQSFEIRGGQAYPIG
jgi:DNA replication and repair protein RecF